LGAAGRAPAIRRCGGDRKIERELRVNERIRAREVRLIDENGQQLGVVPARDALRIARERELDLIEVSPTAQPPVCRIMDYGKHKYLQAKREREAHKRNRPTEVRILVFRNPRIDPHDLATKLKKLREMVTEGNKVRVNLRFRGRELTHPELGTQLFNRIAGELADVAAVELSARLEGRLMSMLLTPRPGARPPAPRPAAPGPPKQEPRPAAPPAAPAPEVAAQPAPQRKTEEDVKQEQVAPRPQVEDTEDSGEAG
jgi:translation initiation factor IF-3